MIHSFAFFFDFLMKGMRRFFVWRQLYCSIHRHTGVSGQACVARQPPPPILPWMLCDICIHTCLHSVYPLRIYRLAGFCHPLIPLLSQNDTFKVDFIKILSLLFELGALVVFELGGVHRRTRPGCEHLIGPLAGSRILRCGRH